MPTISLRHPPVFFTSLMSSKLTRNHPQTRRKIVLLASPITPERWCCQSAALNMPANLENSAVATGLEKVSFHFNPKGKAKECSNYQTIALIFHASKVMLKVLQARLQQYMYRELSDVQAGFRKGRRTRDQIANICRLIEQGNSKKNILLHWLH